MVVFKGHPGPPLPLQSSLNPQGSPFTKLSLTHPAQATLVSLLLLDHIRHTCSLCISCPICLACSASSDPTALPFGLWLKVTARFFCLPLITDIHHTLPPCSVYSLSTYPTETERCLVHTKCLNFFFFSAWINECMNETNWMWETPAHRHGWRLLRVEAGLELSTTSTSSFPGWWWAQWVLTMERAIRQSHKAGAWTGGLLYPKNVRSTGIEVSSCTCYLIRVGFECSWHQSTSYNLSKCIFNSFVLIRKLCVHQNIKAGSSLLKIHLFSENY